VRILRTFAILNTSNYMSSGGDWSLRARKCLGEESPDSTGQNAFEIIGGSFGQAKDTESATENIPSRSRRKAGIGIRVKRWCKRPPPGEKSKGHGKPRLEQDQIGNCPERAL